MKKANPIEELEKKIDPKILALAKERAKLRVLKIERKKKQGRDLLNDHEDT